MKKNVGTIAFVANTSWSIYNFRRGVIKVLLENKYKVVVIAPVDEYSSKLQDLGCTFFDVNIDNYGTNPLKDLSTIFKLINLYYKIKPNLIFHYTIKPNIYGTIAAYINRIPSIAVTTGLGHLFYRNFFTKKITKLLYRLTGHLCTEMWFLNKQDIIDFTKEGIVKQDKIILLNSEGVDTEYFKPIFKPYVDNNKIIFLYAGRLIRDKGLDILLEVAEKMKNKLIEFQVLGFIDDKNPNSISLNEIMDKHNKGIITYLGHTDDVRPFIAQADCIIFPSFYREGISRLLLEGASMGKSIITTDNVGCREVVEDGINGFLCQPNSVESLRAAINEFINMTKEEKQLMGDTGRQIVEREFSEKQIIDFYLKKIKPFEKKSSQIN
jgi:glycosyltransferase involved in cell wall biosynthesis